MFSALTMLVLAIVFAGVRPTTDIFGYVLMFFTIFLTALGLISMMTAYAVRAPAPEVYQFTAFPINLILYFTSGAVYPMRPLLSNVLFEKRLEEDNVPDFQAQV
jgi:hypothetical protein